MQLVGGKGYSGGQDIVRRAGWRIRRRIYVGFEIKFKGWRKAAQKAGRWFRRVEKGAELFTRSWHEAERRKAAERRAKAAAAPSTVDISKRPGRGGGGPNPKGRPDRETVKAGSGHHRLENCGPSNGRHKIA